MILNTGLGIYRDVVAYRTEIELSQQYALTREIREIEFQKDDLQTQLDSEELVLTDFQSLPWESEIGLLKPGYVLRNCADGIREVNLDQVNLGLQVLKVWCLLDNSLNFRIGVNLGSLFDLEAREFWQVKRLFFRESDRSPENRLQIRPLQDDWKRNQGVLGDLTGISEEQLAEEREGVEWNDSLKSAESVFMRIASQYPDMEWNRLKARLGRISGSAVIWIQAGSSFTTPPLGNRGVLAIASILDDLDSFVTQEVSLDVLTGNWEIIGWVAVETPEYRRIEGDLRTRREKKNQLEAEIGVLDGKLQVLRLRELEQN